MNTTSRSRRFVFSLAVLSAAALSPALSAAITKPHVIAFGKWTSVQSYPESNPAKPVPLKIRALIIDTRVREYVLGMPHEVTERLFVVRRVFRVNDSLPEESGLPRWQWQRGGWLLVDRMTGRVSPINLPEFETAYSDASWYRDFVAYCGVSEDGKKVDAVVAELGRRKPLLKKLLSPNNASDADAPDSACPEPAWQRAPARVSFEPAGLPKQIFAIRGHAVDLVNDTEEDEEASK